MVRTSAPHAENPGSIPGRGALLLHTLLFCVHAKGPLQELNLGPPAPWAGIMSLETKRPIIKWINGTFLCHPSLAMNPLIPLLPPCPPPPHPSPPRARLSSPPPHVHPCAMHSTTPAWQRTWAPGMGMGEGASTKPPCLHRYSSKVPTFHLT